MSRIFADGLLAGQTAVVTGGSSGIGLAIAEGFTRLGCEVVIVARRPERLEQAMTGIAERTGRTPGGFLCDVRDEERIDLLREHVLGAVGVPTILVNNAAANFKMAAERMTRRAFSTVLDIDLVGTFNVTRAFANDMIEAARGSILNISMVDAERGFPGFSHAGAAKAGVLSLTRSWAGEWGKHGIRVNGIGPGPVPTAGAAANMLGLADSGDAFADVLGRIPLGRLGTEDDIAHAATFLCSPAAAWITGVNLAVDGGFNLP
ncbi:SDR family oxidoreductase [Kitasatospora sp. GAS204B]|uniref:SDR family oxidoreductase n=1 Tax=unclassified Kitasatospora TaxID=2633591 RepID=UPI0024750DCA|nr:SDR family oxidoreductase [Kitasatospora sp. GAS204B]MDH6118969.1 NAD(P)-dependent dehydrogenase (short-subunit alcohol dehydrogenase family) [Kitasatospora sp. GAS204B]